MKIHFKTIICLTSFLITNKSFSQIANTPAQNPTDQSTGGKLGIGTGAPAAKLEVFSTGNQLRLSNTSTFYSDINTNASGYLNFMPNSANSLTFRIGFNTSAPTTGFHSNMGIFTVTDPAAAAAGRGFQILPYRTANGEIPAGTTLVANNTTSNEGLSIAAGGTGTAGVKLGAYAYCAYGWRSMWETANTGSSYDLPNLLLAKSGGNVGIGTGATAPTAKLEVAGQIKITGGTPGANKVLTSDANGLASWQPVNGLLSGGTTNQIPKWSSASTLANSILYDDGYNVGIGTTTPAERLQVGDRFVFHDGGSKFLGYNVRYNGSSLVRLANNDFVSLISFGSGNINFETDVQGANGSVTNPTSKFFIQNTTGNVGIGSTTPRTKLDVNGKVYIGTHAPSSAGPHSDAQLSVDGKMVAKSCYVTQLNWADFVFDKNYQLPTLSEIETYYKEYKHLPLIPSEQKVKENGVDLGEMNKLLLQKIEELTIFMVEQDKRINQLENKK